MSAKVRRVSGNFDLIFKKESLPEYLLALAWGEM